MSSLAGWLELLGLNSVIELPAREQLASKREILKTEKAYLKAIWDERYPGRKKRASKSWPFVALEHQTNIMPLRKTKAKT